LEVYLVDLDRLLRATTRKGRQVFLGEKCTPDKILATGYAYEKRGVGIEEKKTVGKTGSKVPPRYFVKVGAYDRRLKASIVQADTLKA